MLEPWDIFCWNQHSQIKDLTKYEPNLRSRIFPVGGGAPHYHDFYHCYYSITMAITVVIYIYSALG